MSTLVRWPPGRPAGPRRFAGQILIPSTEVGGPTRAFDGASDYVTTAAGSLTTTTQGARSFVAVLRRSVSADQLVFSLLTSTPVLQAGLMLGSAGNNNELAMQTAGSGKFVTGMQVLTTDGWVLVAVTKAAGTVSIRGHKYRYDTAAWTHTTTAAGTTADPGGTIASAVLGAARPADTTLDYTGLLAVAGVWNRELSDAELETLELDLQAWADLTPAALWPLNQDTTSTAVADVVGAADETALSGTTVSAAGPPGFNWSLSAGGPVALDGIGSASADLDGSLSADRPIAAVGSAAADLDGSASAARPLDATASAAADLDGSAAVTRPLAANASAAADASGALDVAAGFKQLDGVAPAAADLDGSLDTARPLAAMGAAAADLDGSLSADRPLTATGSAAAGATGTASTARPLTAVASAAADLNGTASTTRPIAATAAAAAHATGDLFTSSETALDGIASASASATGSLVVAKVLAGVGSSASEATGSLVLTKTLDASATAASGGTGTATLTRPLAGTTSIAAAWATADLGRARPLAAVLTAAAASTGALDVTSVPPPRWVEGSGGGSGQVEGSGGASGQVEGVLVGAGITEGSASI